MEAENNNEAADERMQKIQEIKDATVNTLKNSISDIKEKAQNVSANPDVQKTIAYIKENAVKAVDLAKIKIDEISNDPKVKEYADKAKEYDHIIFDTAPTGHTLRMLQLPSAWSTFISESTHGASCLGQLSGLEERKGIYKQAVETLSDANATRLVLVSRPEIAPLKEAARSSHELQLLGINNQL